MIYTGLRLEEVLALRWRNIDFSNGKLSVENAIKRAYNIDDNGNKVDKGFSVYGDTKTESSKRCLTLGKDILNILLEWKAYASDHHKWNNGVEHSNTQTEFEKDNFVFGNTRKDHWTVNGFRSSVTKFLDSKSGNEIDTIRFHRIRHFVGTALGRQHKSETEIAQHLGHSQTKTAQRYIDKADEEITMGTSLAVDDYIQKNVKHLEIEKKDNIIALKFG